METTPASSLPIEVEVKPRKSQGRPPKYIAPTDGSPVPPEVLKAIKAREFARRAYQANPEALSKRVYANFKKRQEKQMEALREFEELKRAVAALLPHGA